VGQKALYGMMVAAVAAASIDCGSSSSKSSMACVPGVSLTCGGPGGCVGYQLCQSDGSGYGACRCGAAAEGGLEDATLAPNEDASGSVMDATLGRDGQAGSPVDAGTPEAAPPGPDTGSNSVCDGGTTRILGAVYDPANLNPVYGATVYVPGAVPLPTLPPGQPCGSCSGLYAAHVASAVTQADGTFAIDRAPDGANVPLVVQIGKWRMLYTIAQVVRCVDNPQPDHWLHLPKNRAEGDLPNIAIATGGADTLECLPLRMGVDASEYTSGAGGAGHLHVFTGYMGATNDAGTTPDPNASLWNSSADLSQFDIVMLSCEGQETTFTNQASAQNAMWSYTQGGGRLFASHFHYAWFISGPFATMVNPPLATWTTGTGPDNDPIGGKVTTTRSDGGTFPEGVAMSRWLGNVSALDGGEVPIHFARHNATVGATNVFSQTWITADVGSLVPGAAQYFSFDTPPGQTNQCGRVVYSDLHATAGPGQGPTPDYPGFSGGGVVPDGCARRPLTPQEKALEFMVFDLSSCLVPVGQSPAAP
jgi:hypothetical protein